ncbi:MAG: hypothetical protein E7446_01645 [Ruminococcaceae bacterium]|nr:hypothetical protein [Oscillospiraceae bacterium]
MKHLRIKQALAWVFLLGLTVFFVRSAPLSSLVQLSDWLRQDRENAVGIDVLEQSYADKLWKKEAFLNLNGAAAKLLKMRGYYSDLGMYITDNDYIVTATRETTTDYEVDQTIALERFCRENGINFCYVNQPIKYLDDSSLNRFGIMTYANKNADLFLQRISNAGVPTLDLRQSIIDEGLNIYDMFYRTDHHWTTQTGLWASGKIAERLNQSCGYNIDLTLYDSTNYTVTEWENCWLGEQGQKVGETYVGRDDFALIKPNFPTSYTFKTSEGIEEGTFDNFLNESVYDPLPDGQPNRNSWYYSYLRKNAVNHNVDYGKVLLIGDSYAHLTVPFLSLGIAELDSLILRDVGSDFQLTELILSGGYDTVLVCYAQNMIGSHDSPQSANYAMYSFIQ